MPAKENKDRIERFGFAEGDVTLNDITPEELAAKEKLAAQKRADRLARLEALALQEAVENFDEKQQP